MSRARVRVRCSVWCAGRIELQLELGSSSHVREIPFLGFRFMVSRWDIDGDGAGSVLAAGLGLVFSLQ